MFEVRLISNVNASLESRSVIKKIIMKIHLWIDTIFEKKQKQKKKQRLFNTIGPSVSFTSLLVLIKFICKTEELCTSKSHTGSVLRTILGKFSVSTSLVPWFRGYKNFHELSMKF